MAKWARLENNTVVELTNLDPNGRFHPSLVWKMVPDFVEERYVVSQDEEGNETWLPPVIQPKIEKLPFTVEEIEAMRLAAQSLIQPEETPAP